MGFSHYPKTNASVLVAYRLPRPPRGSTFLNSTINFDDVNLAFEPLLPGCAWVSYHDIQGFTRLFASMDADVPFRLELTASDWEVDQEGQPISDLTIDKIEYRLPIRDHLFDPERRKSTCRLFEIVGVRWLCVRIVNVGSAAIDRCHICLRGSVF